MITTIQWLTYTSLFVVEIPSNNDSIAIHFMGNRPPYKIEILELN